MSRPRSRSSVNSHRTSTMYKRSPGRRDGRPFTSEYGPGNDFDSQWRVPEMHGPPHWDDAPFPRQGSASEWGRSREEFMAQGDRRPQSSEDYKSRRSPLEYTHHRSTPGQTLGYLERRRLSPKGFEEMQSHSPRRLTRERSSSPLTFDHDHRRSPPNWGRNEHSVDHPERQESDSGRGPRAPQGFSPRGRAFSRLHDRIHDRMEHRSYPEEHNEAYRERSPFSDRLQPKRSEFRDHRPEKRSRDMGHYEGQDGPERPYTRSGAPVIVEHDHGIAQRGGGERGDHVHHGGPPQDRHRRHDAREEPRMEPHPKRRRSTPPPPMAQTRHQEPTGDHDIPHHFQKRQAGAPAQDVDLRPDRVDRGAYSGQKWDQKRPEVNQQRRKGGPEMGSQMVRYPHRDSKMNREMPSTSRVDISERETLKIRVDMNRPVGQDRYGLANSNIVSGSLGYNSDRQLSLDLVNVGRQRLDFLPMLEHSGTFRETPVHTGTFAQEIITLVHQVKETYFKGENTTLNDRFTSVMTASPEEEEESVTDRRVNVSVPESMPLFSKIGNAEPQRRPQAFDPGDLRHDLERRRQERLEGVKITISGASFQPAPDSVESEPVFEEEERMGYEDGPHWAEEVPEGRREWGDEMSDMRQRMSWPSRRNKRRPYRSGPQSGPNRRQYHNSANGANW